MKPVHLILGIFFVIVFLLTGQYMNFYNNHMVGVEDAPRLLFRTRHIFILLAGLLNIGIGSYFYPRRRHWRRVLQFGGSALIIAAPVLFTVAFFIEPANRDLHTPFTHWGTYTIGAGTLFHVFSGVGERKAVRIEERITTS
jgi:hypothetical protein